VIIKVKKLIVRNWKLAIATFPLLIPLSYTLLLLGDYIEIPFFIYEVGFLVVFYVAYPILSPFKEVLAAWGLWERSFPTLGAFLVAGFILSVVLYVIIVLGGVIFGLWKQPNR